MKNLKGKLKQHFIKSYVSQRVDAYTGYLEDWDINQAVKEADIEFTAFTAANRNWLYTELKNVTVPEFTNRYALIEMYKKRNEYIGIPANYGLPLEHSVRMAYSEYKLKSSMPEREPVASSTSNDGINWAEALNLSYKKNPAITDTFKVKSEFKFKGFNGSDFPNDEIITEL